MRTRFLESSLKWYGPAAVAGVVTGWVLAVRPVWLVLPAILLASWAVVTVAPRVLASALVVALCVFPSTLSLPGASSAGSAMFAATAVFVLLSCATHGLLGDLVGSRMGRFALLATAPALLSLIINRDDPTLGSYVPGGLAPFVAIPMALWFVGRQSRDDPRVAARAVETLLFVSLPLAAYAAYQVKTGTSPLLDALSPVDFSNASSLGRASSIFGHPIPYGIFAASVALVALVTPGMLSSVALITNLVALALTASRSAWFAFLVGLIFLILFAMRVRLPRRAGARVATFVVLAGVVVFVAPSLLFSANGRVGARVENLDQSFSYQFRARQWAAGWERLKANRSGFIFGYGPGASVKVFDEGLRTELRGPKTFDNAYLSIWFDQGILGVIVLALGLAFALSAPGSPLGRSLFAVVATDVVFYDGYRYTVVAGALALATALVATRQERLIPQMKPAVRRVVARSARNPAGAG